ncbi:MAG: 4-alpha-glucanotransferase [Clostridia bacterium]|nr:4-alpha-glucanotransferase [Clostridia bacterium]
MARSAGILMPITSLPSPYGIGTLGKAAYEFVDFLKEAGQKYWQLLPVGPTSYGDSPYQSFSTYAGNPYMIDLDMLCDEGLLVREDLKKIDWGDNSQYVDYEKQYNERFKVLRTAYDNYKKGNQREFWDFCHDENDWLTDYALYMAVKKYFGEKPWTEWPAEDIKYRYQYAIDYYINLLKDDVMFWKFTQFLFYKQWNELKKYANDNGILLFGDMPIYVAMDSADTWANPDVFWLDDDRKPVCVAGCPPDYFSETGQLWGNPLYDWIYLEETGYDWWIKRVAGAARLFDVTRIDHFRAFDAFYAIPYGEETAVNGEWIEGPKINFFNKMKERLGDVPIIAEDLGYMTPGVKKLLKESGYPGMKILEFAFDSKEDNDYLPHNYTTNSVCYIGTHDNDTAMGWLKTASKKDFEFAKAYCNLSKTEGYNWGFIRTAYASVSDYAIVQMQDILGLGSEARMNIPSTLGGNWTWRMKKGAATPQIAQRLYNLSKIYRRLEDDKNMKKNAIIDNLILTAKNEYCKELNELSPAELHDALGKAMMGEISERWEQSKKNHAEHRRAYYFSAEFLMGRMMYNNLYAMDVLDQTKKLLADKGIDINVFEEIDDAALGNGGLGRLAACFLDSAATHDVPLDGYGIRYKYGLFKQQIIDGFQVEVADDWQRFGDPWCIRRNEDIVTVKFADQTVKAVPYDMAVIGYGTENVNTLRLWQAEAVNDFDFLAFNDSKYDQAVKEKNDAENISKVLYPNDNSYEGKVLRLKQQYFFCSASLQDIIKRYKKKHGNDYSQFAAETAIQLNDTHPVVSIPELIRLLQNDGLSFDQAFEIAQKTFAYTNHTVMAEALEKWDNKLIISIIPEIYDIIVKINDRLIADLTAKGLNVPVETAAKAETEETDDEDKKEETPRTKIDDMKIIDGNLVHMARLAIYASSYTNGVAWIHTEILKNDVLKDWYAIYPERFQNKTNGITQRRWLGLCNPELSELITDNIGSKWVRNLDELKKLEPKIDDKMIDRFNEIKSIKKKQLSDFIAKNDNVYIDPSFIFDVQVKRLHEYKRQLLNAFSIMAIYFRLKEGKLPDFTPTAFIFGAKAAPGYARAKAIIKYINEIAKLINNDPDVNQKLRVVFVANYNVSYAEKIVTAADVSEQISTAGTEASGTGNMKFMLNGAVTLGTYDGANVEIAQQAGEENEYIFGARVEEINEIKDSYDPKKIYDSNPEVKRVIDTLIDGRFTDGGKTGEGSFAELHKALLEGASWHQPDHYFILRDLPDYIDAKLKVNADYKDRRAFGKKCLINTANAGMFSSDRTILQYATELWKVK